MVDPVLILVGCLLAAGAWALPVPAPAEPPPRWYSHDLQKMFPPNQLSRLGRVLFTPGEARLDPDVVKEAVRSPRSRAQFAAYEYAVRSHREWIYYVMKRDEGFLTCMESEMGKDHIGPDQTKPYDLSTFFFAAEVCQERGGHWYSIYFPRVEDFYPKRKEFPQFSKENVLVRAREKPDGNALQHTSTPPVSLPALPSRPLHALSRMISNVGANALRVEKGVERGVEKAPWAKWEAEPKALLLESRY
ncbi:MAG: hypothetical protein M1826_004048 [Phylliscum demangeonii]|nr:MAG: hypothetical protein M1826_004048 [Phylliscum demangeonii]